MARWRVRARGGQHAQVGVRAQVCVQGRQDEAVQVLVQARVQRWQEPQAHVRELAGVLSPRRVLYLA